MPTTTTTSTAVAATTGPEQWGRRRLARTLLLVVAAGLVLLVGLGYAIHTALATTGPSGSSHPASTGSRSGSAGAGARDAGRLPPGPERRDAIAAAPMLTVPPAAARSGIPAATPGPTVTIPAATRVGPGQVPTGFGHTPAGAVGQLAAIETTVLAHMSIERAHQVHRAWSAPGAVPAGSWELTRAVQAFLASRAGQHTDEPATAVTAIPVAGQVKGTDGPDWVLACVLLDVRAHVAATARIAYGHCDRLQWVTDDEVGGRWVIAPGPAPATAPSTWPGTDLAYRAGWRTWTTDQHGTDRHDQ